jgi:uncharacterized membrane protein
MDITPTGKDAVTTPHTHNHTEAFLHMFDGMHVKFPTFKHEHPPVIDINKVADERLTLGQKVADKVASGMGSWRFIIIQSFILVLWAVLNSVGWWSWKWDLYPFIAMNLLLSCQAAYAAPVIMMSQNRQAEKDRLTAQNDYLCDTKGEEEIRYIMEHLDHQDTVILQILQRMEVQHKEVIFHLSQLDPEMARRLGTDLQQLSEKIIDEGEDIGGNS